MRRLTFLLVTSIGLWGSPFPTEQFNTARTLYYRGADGDKAGYEKAAALFSTMHSEQPDDPRVQAYYGSLRLLEASHTWALWKKNSLSKEGIRLMDAAVTKAPENLDIRFVRAATTYSLPSFFQRAKQSEQDFEYLVRRAVQATREGKLEPRLAAASFYFHAEFLRKSSRNNQAIAAWKQAIAIAPQSRAARDSAGELRKLRSE